MTIEDRERLQASIRQRLLDLARRSEVDFQLVLTRYGLERLLHRVGRSTHKASFLLKGAFLFHAWQDEMARPTRDLDLLGSGSPDIARLEAVVAEIVNTEVEDDGLDFQSDTIRGEAIREAFRYDGVRLKLTAALGSARIPLQVDVGFGDAAGQQAVELEYPPLLDQEAPRVLSYSPEYVVAEKLEAVVVLGEINSRLKDYYDLWWINRSMDLRREDLVAAIRATFSRRGTDVPLGIPPGLADGFAGVHQSRMWDAFLQRNGLDVGDRSLGDVVERLRSWLGPLLGDVKSDS